MDQFWQEAAGTTKGTAEGTITTGMASSAFGTDLSGAAQPASSEVAWGYANEGENEFNDFEEDEMGRKAREEEERINQRLREKSQREYNEKQERKKAGQAQLEEFQTRKESEKRERVEENARREEKLQRDLKAMQTESGWDKVAANVNMKQGEQKSKKDITRMRESIQHIREDKH